MTLEEAQAKLKELQDNRKRFADLMMASWRNQCDKMVNMKEWRSTLITEGMLWMVDEVERIFDADIKEVQGVIDYYEQVAKLPVD